MANRMLNAREVVERVGLHRNTIWKQVRAGKFPAPHELAGNKIGWPESTISTWLNSRPRRTYGAEPAPKAGVSA